jgi:hypothetical protein
MIRNLMSVHSLIFFFAHETWKIKLLTKVCLLSQSQNIPDYSGLKMLTSHVPQFQAYWTSYFTEQVFSWDIHQLLCIEPKKSES